MNTMKKKIWKMSGAVLMALTLTIGCIGVNTATVQAAEYSVAPATAVLYTGSGAEVFAQPDPATLVTVLPGDVPLQVTGMTSNGYFQVVVNDGIFYVYGKALSAAGGGLMNRELYNLSDENTKLLLLIYEMAKSGAITLDSSKMDHAQIMYDYLEYVRRMKGKKEKRQLNQLILLQVIKHSK